VQQFLFADKPFDHHQGISTFRTDCILSTLEKVFRRTRMETVNALTHKPPEDQFFRGLVH